MTTITIPENGIELTSFTPYELEENDQLYIVVPSQILVLTIRGPKDESELFRRRFGRIITCQSRNHQSFWMFGPTTYHIGESIIIGSDDTDCGLVSSSYGPIERIVLVEGA